jgi:osmotically-inducible protein OsmY
MNSRYDTSHDHRNWERPRDEHGRFESEYDQRRGASREGQRYESRYDSGRYENEDPYASRNEPMRADYDRGEYEGSRRPDRFGSPGRSQGQDDRFDRDASGYRSSGDWNERSSYGNSDYGRSGRGASQLNWSGGSPSRSFHQSDFGEDRDQIHWPSSGSNNRTESLFGVSGGYRTAGTAGNGRSMGGFESGSDQWNRQGEQSNRQSYAGRGPKGYRRSDERIQEDVSEALAQHPEIDASEIEVKVSNGEVTLSGTVTERSFKRMAEDIVERCSGVQDVKNDIRVQRETESNGSAHNQMKNKGTSTTGMKTPESKSA